MTYGQLDAMACALARRLHSDGIASGATVGLAMSCGIDLVSGVLACARLGAQFLPMDPGYPLRRLQYMAERSGAQLVLLNRESDESRLRLFLQRQQFLLLPLAPTSLPEVDPVFDLADPTTCTDTLAYTLFTSGSTGDPKGVQISHGSLANLLLSMRDELSIEPGNALRFLALTTPSFDIALLELLLPLVCGGEVLFSPDGANRDPRLLAQTIAELKPSHVQATPTTWQMLLATGWKPERQTELICGGEGLPEATAAGLLATGCPLFNAYGPTETTIWSSVGRITDSASIHVGGPLRNTSFSLVDSQMNRVSANEVGELCIGGAGLARGYLNQPELTRDRFPELAGERVYRTGDLARWKENGQLEILGRIDSQVKLHGHRIELGEIEARLLAAPGVASAAVVVSNEAPAVQRLLGFFALSSVADCPQPEEAALHR